MKEIKQILVDNIGWIYATDGKIENFVVNGEMALVNWYRQGNKEYNGRFVVMIEYVEDK